MKIVNNIFSNKKYLILLIAIILVVLLFSFFAIINLLKTQQKKVQPPQTNNNLRFLNPKFIVGFSLPTIDMKNDKIPTYHSSDILIETSYSPIYAVKLEINYDPNVIADIKISFPNDNSSYFGKNTQISNIVDDRISGKIVTIIGTIDASPIANFRKKIATISIIPKSISQQTLSAVKIGSSTEAYSEKIAISVGKVDAELIIPAFKTSVTQ